jgi:hypothetical protein
MSAKTWFVAFSALLIPALASAQSSPPLQQVLADVTASYNKQERPMVVFDLEGTLLDNRPRILQILQEFSRETKYITPDAAQKLSTLTLPLIQYRLNDTLASVGIMDKVVVDNAAAFWAERFYNDEYLKYDQPTPGSVDFVRRLYSSGARIVYVSGRDAQRQLIGTVKALRQYGYPIGIQGTELIMKPTVTTQDAIFKQQITNYLRHFGTVVAAFDTEPANANVYRRAFPDATVAIYEAPRAPNPPPLLADVQRLVSFQ